LLGFYYYYFFCTSAKAKAIVMYFKFLLCLPYSGLENQHIPDLVHQCLMGTYSA
jgi:hypothetical protein